MEGPGVQALSFWGFLWQAAVPTGPQGLYFEHNPCKRLQAGCKGRPAVRKLPQDLRHLDRSKLKHSFLRDLTQVLPWSRTKSTSASQEGVLSIKDTPDRSLGGVWMPEDSVKQFGKSPRVPRCPTCWLRRAFHKLLSQYRWHTQTRGPGEICSLWSDFQR